MARAADTKRDDARKALALIRRLRRPAPWLLDLLALADDRITRQERVEALLEPVYHPSALPALLDMSGGDASDDSIRKRGSFASELHPPRHKSTPPSAGRENARAPSKKRGDVAPFDDTKRDKNVATHSATANKKTGAPGGQLDEGAWRTAGSRKPLSLKDVAKMRQAQQRTSEIPASKIATAVHSETPNSTTVAQKQSARANPASPTSTKKGKPLASKRSLSRALKQFAQTRNAPQSNVLPLQAGKRAPVASGGLGTPQTPTQNLPAFEAVKEHQTENSEAESGATPDKSDTVCAPPNPDRPQRSAPDQADNKSNRSTRKTGLNLADLAWRNGVEPR